MMGMGEPLANFDNVVAALKLFLDDNAYGLSRRRVTLSTSGLVPMIDRLREECPVALAVSLHAPDDALRDRIVPINRKHPIAELIAACNRYLPHAPRDFVTFEYVMLDGVNDSTGARARARARSPATCRASSTSSRSTRSPAREFRTSPRERIRAFQQVLQDAGITTTMRKTRGDDIDAACGQLAGQVQDRIKRRARDAHRRRALTSRDRRIAPHAHRAPRQSCRRDRSLPAASRTRSRRRTRAAAGAAGTADPAARRRCSCSRSRSRRASAPRSTPSSRPATYERAQMNVALEELGDRREARPDLRPHLQPVRPRVRDAGR